MVTIIILTWRAQLGVVAGTSCPRKTGLAALDQRFTIVLWLNLQCYEVGIGVSEFDASHFYTVAAVVDIISFFPAHAIPERETSLKRR